MTTQTFNRIKNVALLGIVLFLIVGTAAPRNASAAFADEKKYVLLAPIPGTYEQTNCKSGTMNTHNSNGQTTGNGASTENCTTDFVTYLKGFFRLVISLSSIIAVLVITYEGFKLVVSTTEGARDTAKERIQQALIGLGLVLGSYLILNTINPQLTKISFAVDKVADYAGTSAYFEDDLSQSLKDERAAEAQRMANREALQTYSQSATLIIQELAAMNNCSDRTEEAAIDCLSRKASLESELRQLQSTTDLRAYIGGINLHVTNNVLPLIELGRINEARAALGQTWNLAQINIANLRNQGREAEANVLLQEAQKLQQTTNARINSKASAPVDGDLLPSGM